jgi:hypothetical protein
LEHPKRDRNRRRAPRVSHGDFIGYSEPRRDGLFHLLGTGKTLDLSETGLRATTAEPLPLGKVLAFSLKMGDTIHRFRGRVVWCAELEAEKSYESGVRFQEIAFELARSLWELLGDTAAENTPSEPLKLTAESDPNAPSCEAFLESVAPATFSPLSNKPLSPERVERELAEHVAAGTGNGTDPALLEELLWRALEAGPSGGFTSLLELRDALTRAVEEAASKSGEEPVAKGSERLLARGGAPKDRRTPPRKGMAGHFRGDQLAEFVQMLGLNNRTGILEVSSAARTGHMAFREGRIVAARTADGLRSEAAAQALLSLPKGDFRFRPDFLASLVVEHELAVEGVLLDVARRRDETTGTNAGSPGQVL